MNIKKIISFFMAAVLAAGVIIIPAAAEAIGDVDGSGKVDSYDSLIVLRHSVNLEQLSEQQKKLADIDENNTINSADALYILRMSVGLEPFKKEIPQLSPEKKQSIEKTLSSYKFDGVVYAQKEGQPYYSFAQGELENGEDVTMESPMPIGSTSKQFCAAAVLLLSEQGKLSLDDTMDKYFPKYAEGNRVKLFHMLSMRSGIPDLPEELNITYDNTDEENTALIKNSVFNRKLVFEPGKRFMYTNTNYLLLANIVEQVSGKKYSEFLRENFFEPLGMKHTGTIAELSGSLDWSKGVVIKQVDLQPGITKGCGDVISSAYDMTLWMDALTSGKAVSKESYRAMTTDQYGDNYYGYGMFLNIKGGVGHPGMIGIYSAYNYINEDKGLTLIVMSNSIYPPEMNYLFSDILPDFLE